MHLLALPMTSSYISRWPLWIRVVFSLPRYPTLRGEHLLESQHHIPYFSVQLIRNSTAMSVYIPRSTSAGTCANLANLTACSFSDVFCCPPSTACIPLTANQDSVICCPSGLDCTYIRPVTCDITLQNPAEFPYNTLHTTQLNTTLPSCGGQCCPLGYTCQDGACAMNTRSSSTATNTSTTAETPTSASSISIVGASTQPISDASSKSTSQTRAIVVGLFGGILLGIILTIAIWLVIRHRRNSNKRRRFSAEIFGGKTPRTVSEPLFTPQYGNSMHRTDFLRTPATQRTSPYTFGSASTVVGSENPQTPLSQMKVKRGSGLPPLFTSPLRFGLPVSPAPVPKRPARPDETRPHEALSQGQSIPKMRQPSPPVAEEEERNRGRSIARQNSDESYISTGSKSAQSNKTTRSSETINVLMPAFVKTERKEAPNRGVSTYTTMTLMMDGIGPGGGKSSRM